VHESHSLELHQAGPQLPVFHPQALGNGRLAYTHTLEFDCALCDTPSLSRSLVQSARCFPKRQFFFLPPILP